MKMWKKVLTFVLTAALLVTLPTGNVFAAEKESYKYTVTFYSGNQGDFNGAAGLSVDNANAVISQTGEKITISGLNVGDVVSYNAQAGVSLDATSKYYVQGVRLSGRDNDTVAASVFRVDEDADYVVAYGIKGNQTSYVVNYYDENGNALVESEVFYGNVGDKPVVAYKYIEGYVPQAMGLTKTLSENVAENVFTFVYEEAPTPTIEEVPGPGGEGTGTGTGTTTPGGQGGTGTTTPGSQGGTGTDTPGNQGGTDTDTPDGQGGTGTDTPEGEGDVIVDLDDPETPLGNIDIDKDDKDGSLLTSIGVAAVGGIGLIAVIVLVIMMRKRKK